MSRNFKEVSAPAKEAMKPLVAEIRKQLYGTSNNAAVLSEGLVINFGKRTERRHTVKIQILDDMTLAA